MKTKTVDPATLKVDLRPYGSRHDLSGHILEFCYRSNLSMKQLRKALMMNEEAISDDCYAFFGPIDGKKHLLRFEFGGDNSARVRNGIVWLDETTRFKSTGEDIETRIAGIKEKIVEISTEISGLKSGKSDKAKTLREIDELQGDSFATAQELQVLDNKLRDYSELLRSEEFKKKYREYHYAFVDYDSMIFEGYSEEFRKMIYSGNLRIMHDGNKFISDRVASWFKSYLYMHAFKDNPENFIIVSANLDISLAVSEIASQVMEEE